MWLIAGPNGSGKSTLAHTHFTDIIERGDFLNADDIAASISPDTPRLAAAEAGRLLITARNTAIAEGRSLVIESTLASRTLLRSTRMARESGYMIGLIYLWITDPELCNQRIAVRVEKGGHFIPPEIVVRRYWKSLQMLPLFLAEAHEASIFSADYEPLLLAEKNGAKFIVFRDREWAEVQAAMS